LRQYPSINDSGQVAFIGALSAGGEAVFAGIGAGTPSNLSLVVNSNITYLASAQINNAGKVLATQRSFSPQLFNSLKLWDINNPGSAQSLAGDGEAGTSILTFASLANNANATTGAGVVFGAITSAGAPVTLQYPDPPLGFG